MGVRVLLVTAPALIALSACQRPEASGPNAPRYATEFTAVEVDPGEPTPLKLAVQACAGLKNRALGGSVYVEQEASDGEWLDELGLEPKEVVGASEFLDACLSEFPSCVRYDYGDQQELLPSILTVGAALGAVPVDVGMSASCGDVVFDAPRELAERDTPALAAKFVFETYGDRTTGLAMLNPGYDQQSSEPSDPALTTDASPALVDFVFSQRLFDVFLVNGCTTSDPEREVLDQIVNDSRWPTPLGVYGYNNSWNIGGYLYEAQTRCLDSRNMGAVPTETGNLSFFSTRRAAIVTPGEIEPNEPEDLAYDPGTTYVAFVVGDGDNVRYLMTSRREWLRQRLEGCGQPDPTCEPLSWTLSPHLPHLAPDVLEWYAARTDETGRDDFLLPPSGHFYAYPSSLNEEDQGRFATQTEADARILGVGGTVHWDMFDSWHVAEDHFLPRYAHAGNAVRGVFPVNVPYIADPFPWWPADQFFRVIEGEDGGEVVVFRPREWRGVDDDQDPFFLSPERMADELAGYPPGTVTWVYMTSDGGLTLENSFTALSRILPAHVRLVTADTATKLALAADGP